VTYTKVCRKCKKEKSVLEFRVSDKHKDGIHSQCNDCKKVTDAAYRKTHREYYQKKCREWRVLQKEKSAAL
jgi:hypothetical protein